MALRFCDSFDHYATADVLDKWTGFGASSLDFFIDTVHPRTGRACAGILRNGVFKTIADKATWTVGFAVQWNGFGGGLRLVDINTTQVSLQLQADGTFLVFGAALLGHTDPAFAVNLNRYYYLEVKATIGNSGSCEVRLNGQVLLSVSGVDTDNTGNAKADVIQLIGPGGGNIMYVDDLYVNDADGGVNDTFLGDTSIGLIMPASDGDFLQWTPTPAGTHFDKVNEVPPDGDATYVSDATPGDIDCYHFQTVDVTRSYKAIQTNIIARKDDSANRALSILTRIGGNNFVADPGGKFVNQTYIDYLNQFDVNPATGLAWTGADINAAQWGIKLIA